MRASSSSSSLLTRLPFNSYSPLEGVSKQPIIFIRVVFPEPDGPIIEINSPFSTDKLIPLRAFTS